MNETPPTPRLDVSEAALQQLELIQRHDYTLAGKFFRIKIGGKGCAGFTYETGFTEKGADDVEIHVGPLTILLDRFTAFYTQNATLDHVIDPVSNEEGFVVHNRDEALYRGKFYKDTDLVPPWGKT